MYCLCTYKLNYWICITNKENWNVIANEHIWGVKYSQKRNIERIEIGDKIIFYVKGGILKGIFESNSMMYESKEKLFNPHPLYNQNEIYSLRIKLNLITPSILESNIMKILENISFIIKKKNWAVYFFRTLIKISKEDYLNIKKSMKKDKHLLSNN